ncbi:MAG TPA: HEPN domain-containing protein [Solirubrobacteraceae bacterium]
MNKNNDTSWQGSWTMPDGHILAGELTFSNEEGAVLRAYGSREQTMRPEMPWMVALHGQTVDGKDITLLEATLRHHQDYLFGGHDDLPTSQVWHANTVIVGAHVDSEEDLQFQRCTFRLSGLTEWLTEPWNGPPFFELPPAPFRRGRRRHQRTRARRARPRRTTTARRRRVMLAARARAMRARRNYLQTRRISGRFDGARILASCGEHRQVRGPFLESTELVSAVDVTLPEPIGLTEWDRDWIRPVQDLLVLCTGRPCEIEGITARFRVEVPPFVRPALPDHRTIQVTIEIHQAGMVEHVTAERNQRILLPRDAIGPDEGRLIQEWFALHRKIGRAGVFFFATLNERSQWLENQLLNLTSFAESYHARLSDHPRFDLELNRKLTRCILASIENPEVREAWREKVAYAPRLTQRERITELFEWACWPVPALQQFPDLAAELVNTRNHLTHFGPKRKHIIEDLELARAVQRLVVVLQANMLMDLGGQQDAVAIAIARGYWQHPVLDPSLDVQHPDYQQRSRSQEADNATDLGSQAQP